MTDIRLTYFGAFQVELDGIKVTFRSVKGQALLAYLAVEHRHPHQRSTLAGLLWPDEPETRARKNLSQTLLEVRKAIDDTNSPLPLILVTPSTLSINPDAQLWTDISAFDAALSDARFAEAVGLYRGLFLHNFSIPDSELFESWVTIVREKQAQKVQGAFTKLALAYEEQGNYEQAIHAVRHLLEFVPWKEEAHQQLMRLLALSGQRSSALAQYDVLSQMLLDEFGILPAPETDSLYDQILSGCIATDTVASSTPMDSRIRDQVVPKTTPHQEIALPPYFVGRQSELARLQTSLSGPGLQVYAIVGIDGVGKTALATKVAHELEDQFPDGVLWGNPSKSTPLDILASWASAYGYDFGQMTDIESRAAAVRGLLAEKRVLLVIDNVNQSADAQSLLPGGEGCAVLLTTRDLDVAHTLNAETLLLEELTAENALELLEATIGTERVRREAEAAHKICHELSNHPLAVELSAQRLKSRPRMKLAQMAERLSDQHHRLDLQISDRAVRTSFEVSWETLDDDLKVIFPLLAVFEGRSFTTEAVMGLASSGFTAAERQQSWARLDVEDALFALEALSLVREEGDARWRQQRIVADYAREKLEDEAATYALFSDYFHAFSRNNATKLKELEPEWENILAAMQVAFDRKRWPLVIDLATILGEPWLTCARYTDARLGFSWAVKASKQIGDAKSMATHLRYWGEACLEQNDYSESTTHLEESLAYYRTAQEQPGIAVTQDLLARIAIENNDYPTATRLLDENLQLYSRAKNQSGIASVHFQKARIEYASAHLADAQKEAEKAQAIQLEMQDVVGQIRTDRLLAQIYLIRKEYAPAYDACLLARTLSEESHNTSELAITLYTLTAILHRQEELDAAQATAKRSLHLLRRMGHRRIEGMLLSQLSDIQKSMGNIDSALDFAEESVEIARSFDDRVALAHALIRASDLYADKNMFEKSQQSLDAVHLIAEQLGNHSLKRYVQQRQNKISSK